MNKEEKVRSLLMPVVEQIAQPLNVCVITIGHLNKRGAEAAVNDRFMGAAAFSGVARKSFVFGPDPNDDDKFAHIMGLVRATSTPALKYKTVAVPYEWDGKTSQFIQIKWLGQAENVDVDEVVNAPKQRDKSTAKNVRQLIKTILRNGQKTTDQVKEALKEAGIDTEKFSWQREASKVAHSGKGGVDKRGEKFFWSLEAAQQTTFDVSKTTSEEGRLTA